MRRRSRISLPAGLMAALLAVVASCSSSKGYGCHSAYEGTSCQCDAVDSSNDLSCDPKDFDGAAACVSTATICECYQFACGGDWHPSGSREICSFKGAVYGDLPSTEGCTGTYNCMDLYTGLLDLMECKCASAPQGLDGAHCYGTDIEVPSCRPDELKKAYLAQSDHDAVVSTCRAGGSSALEHPIGSSGGSGGSSSGGTGGSSSGGPKCTDGVGTCGDKPELNACKCGAACFRNATSAGAGYSCHVPCSTDADCDNVFSTPSTCKAHTLDLATQLWCE